MDNSDLIRRIEALEKENADLKAWQTSVNQLLNQMIELVSKSGNTGSSRMDVENEIRNLWLYAITNRNRLRSLPYELEDPDYHSFFFKPHILSIEETIEKVVSEHKSLARLGDGEFSVIAGVKRWNFQGVSDVLADKLKNVLSNTDSGLMVGLHPTFYMNLFDLEDEGADGVRAYMTPEVRRLHASLLKRDVEYANALFHRIESEEDVERLRKIWHKKDCVFIEGTHTCMGVGNDLFDNCKSIERIIGPAENAVNVYDRIMDEARKQPKDKLFLLALGPTATALAYDLFLEGYQAIDIGHVDLVYEKYLRNQPDLFNLRIPYKYCNIDERVSGREIEDVTDSKYLSEIIAKVL